MVTTVLGQELALNAAVLAFLPAMAAMEDTGNEFGLVSTLALCGKRSFGSVDITGGFTWSCSRAFAPLVRTELDSATTYRMLL